MSASPRPMDVTSDADLSRNGLALKLTDLSVEVKSGGAWVEVVDTVNLSVGKDEIVGIVGESGSGKTLLSLAIMGLMTPTSRVNRGRVEINGRDITNLRARELADVRGVDVAMIFQEPRRCLNPAFTIGDQIAESLRRHKGWSRRKSLARAKELLELVEIPLAEQRLKQYPHELSGGMCQRVVLAIALACEPTLLIADEPTTALDATVQRQVLELIRRLQRELGLGVLLITHDLGIVAEMCDRVGVMYAGQLVEHAMADTLFYEPGHPYTSALLQSMPQSTARGEALRTIPGRVPTPVELPATCRFEARCAHSDANLCSVPIPLIEIGVEHQARCVRTVDLQLPGVDQ